jgi:transposase-like protein/IS1 family transposase
LTCHNCKIEMVKAGLGRNSIQRFKCQTCGKRFSEPQQKPFGADVRLPQETVCQILHCLVEGNSVRGTARLCGVEKRTVLNVLALAGENCERILGDRMKNAPVQDVQCDEIWSFVGKKEGHKRPSEAETQEIGDAYTFIAIESNSKLIFAWHLGKRTLPHTEAFITKIRLVTRDSRFQISTDGFRPYVQAIDMILADRVDYSQVVKVYGKLEGGREARYSPGEVTDIVKTPMLGNPDMKRSSTSHIERQNGSLRQWCKRLTRLTCDPLTCGTISTVLSRLNAC